jgi:hypothetical protein
LRDWLGSHSRENAVRGRKRDNGEKPFNCKVCSNIKEGEESTEIVGLGIEAKSAFFTWK